MAPGSATIISQPIYQITGGNFDATGLDATIEWVDSLGNVVQTLSNQPLSGQLLWPGMVLSGGVPIDWRPELIWGQFNHAVG